jgi:hypothetical protein
LVGLVCLETAIERRDLLAIASAVVEMYRALEIDSVWRLNSAAPNAADLPR